MTEYFDTLSVAGETVSEEDRVVYLLASLPESYTVQPRLSELAWTGKKRSDNQGFG